MIDIYIQKSISTGFKTHRCRLLGAIDSAMTHLCVRVNKNISRQKTQTNACFAFLGPGTPINFILSVNFRRIYDSSKNFYGQHHTPITDDLNTFSELLRLWIEVKSLKLNFIIMDVFIQINTALTGCAVKNIIIIYARIAIECNFRERYLHLLHFIIC